MFAHTYSANSIDPKALQSTNKGHLEKENWNNPAENQIEIKKTIFWRSWDRPSGRKPKTLQKTKKNNISRLLTKTCRKPKKTKKTIFQRSWTLGCLQKEFWNIVFFVFFLFFLVFSRSWHLGWLKKSSEILFFLFFLFSLFFSRSWHLGVTQERVLKYFFCFLQVFCFLRACPRTSRILFSLFLCWFSAGFWRLLFLCAFCPAHGFLPRSQICFLFASHPGLVSGKKKQPLLFLYLSTEISTFLFSFLLNSLLFSSLFYWIPYLFFTCLLKSLLSVHFSIEISAFFI